MSDCLNELSEEEINKLSAILAHVKGNDASAIGSVKDMLEKTSRGDVRQSIHNCVIAMQNDLEIGGKIKKNSFTEQVFITDNPGWKRESSDLISSTDESYIRQRLEQQYGLTSEKKIRDAVNIVANENQFHPIRDYLNAIKWDGKERIRYALHHFLGADESELTYKCLLLYMMQGINRVFSPGCKADYMLCIVGDQGAGKSTFFRFLALKDEWFSDDLRKIDDENVYRKMQGHWIIEMSEMITAINAKTVEEIKSFLTRTKENYKVPYEIHPADRQRQCIFGGTTNRKQFLPFDRTGNRRFLPIETNFVKAECHILDDEKTSREYFIQMWAEAMSVYKSGKYCLHFDKETEEELDAYRRNFMEEDTKVGMIQSWLDKTGEDYVCSTMIYKEALNHKFDAPKNWELKEVCEIMNHCISGWAEGPTHRFGGEYGTQRSWVRNNLQNSFNDLALPF